MPAVSGTPMQAVELVELGELVGQEQQMEPLEVPDQPVAQTLVVAEPWSTVPWVLVERLESAVRPALAVVVVTVDLAAMPYAIRSILLIRVPREPLVVLVAPEASVVLVAPLATGAMADQSRRRAMEPW